MRVFLFLAFLLPLQVHAETSVSSEDLVALQHKLANIQTLISQGLSKDGPGCSSQVKPSCSFADLCAAVVANRNKTSIYQTADGYKMPNYSLIQAYNQISACAGSPDFADLRVKKDPFINPDLFEFEKRGKPSAQAEAYRETYRKQLKRAEGIFEQARAEIINVLTHRQNETNRDVINGMIERVKSVKMRSIYDFNPAELPPDANCELANSEYFESANKVLVCPQLLEWPAGTLFGIFSHELGHSVDPCSLKKALAKNPVTGEPALLERGLQSKKGELADPLTSNQNPFSKVVSCLGASLAIPPPNKDLLKSQLEKQIQDLQKDGADSDDPTLRKLQRQSHDVEDDLESYLCDSGKYLLREAFADWMSSQAVSLRLQEVKGSEAASLALESQMHLLEMGCSVLQNNQVDKINEAMSKAHCQNGLTVQWILDRTKIPKTELDHPLERDRVTKIFMAQPELQKALSCQPLKNPSCQ